MEGFADAVLDWYDRHARDLPWRRPGTPAWGVLVSEVMLQQTPVGRVLPAYEAWLARWPVPADLAADPPGEAVRMWGKLGYPRRALRLHETARALVERHGGTVPAELDELLALPGVGAYTARAVASFAYGRRHPVVDTNVRRLVARAVLGQGDAGPPSTTRDLAAVEVLLPVEPARAARFAVAAMEVGALVCTARGRRGAATARSAPAARGGSPAVPRTPGRRRRRSRSPAPTGRCAAGSWTCCAAATRRSPPPTLAAAWSDDLQRTRALDGLVADGLVEPLADGRFALPG